MSNVCRLKVGNLLLV